MSNKDVNLKVRIGTEGGEKVLKFAEDIENAVKRQKKLVTEQESLEKSLAEAIKTRATGLKLLEADRINLNAQVRKGLLSQQEAFYNLQASAKAYNSILATTGIRANEIAAKLKSISAGKNLGIGEGIKPMTGGTTYTPFSSAAFSGAKTTTDIAIPAPEIAKANTNLKEYNKTLAESIVKHKSLTSHIIEIASAYKIYNTALTLTRETLLAIPRAGIQMQQTQASVFAIFGGAEGLKNLRELRELAQSAGQSLVDLETSYRSFAPSAMLAGASQADVNTIFKNFTETATVLHLTTDQTKSLYLALEQMYAKTTVQSEEIKKQLGNVLPGAVEIGAKAWEKAINAGKASSEQTKVSVADFMAAMKKNLVITKEFAPYFAEEYREIFGGKNDEIFLDTRTKLYSNLQRIKTDFELFARGMFSLTEEVMNDTVKLGASMLETFTANLTGIAQAFQALAVISTASIGKSFLVWATGATVLEATGVKVNNLVSFFTTLGTRISILGAVFSPMIAGTAAVIAGLSSLLLKTNDVTFEYERFTNASKDTVDSLMRTYAAQGKGAQEAGEMLRQLTEESKSFFVTFNGQGISIGNIFSALGDNIATSFTLLFEKLKSGFNNIISAITSGLSNIVSGFYSMVRDSLQALYFFIDDIKARFIATRTYFEEFGSGEAVKKSFEAYDAAIKEYNTASDKQLINFDRLSNKASNFFASVGNSIASLSATATNAASGLLTQALAPVKGSVESVLLAAAEKQRGENKGVMEKLQQRLSMEGVTPDPGEVKPKVPGGKGSGGSKGAAKGIADSYRAAFEDIKAASVEMQQDIANALDRITGLYEDNSLSIREYFGQKKQLQQTDIAVQKDVLEQELQLAFAQKDKVKIAQLSREIRKVEAEDSKKSVENIRQEIIEYRKLNDLKVSISKNILEAQGKNVEASVLSYYQANREAYAKAEAEGDTGLTGQLNALGQREASLANITKIEEDRTRVNDVYNASLAKTNTLYNTGAITQLEAAYRTTNDNEKHIAQLEELIRKEEQAQQAVPAFLTNPKDADRLRALRDELGNLKLEANAVGQYIQAQLTPALSDAFVGFATGAMTAKESFVSFAKGIMEQIAKIAAQKLAMEIIGGLLSLAGSTASSGFGSGYSATTGLGNTSVNYGLADGGVTSGMGIGNGVVLSSPTYFPNAKPTAFASGGVVAGEAGYEAALPLKRLKSGKLGVSMEGAGNASGGIVIQNMNITLQAREDQTSEEQSKQIGEAIKANLKVLVQQELSSAKRSGGQLNPTQLAASF